MATSLAEQLKRLSVPQTNLFKDDTKRASLLFDPKDAAGLRKETVYEIGLEGLEELIAKNEDFKQFKSSLFHTTSKNFERAVQTKEANKKVNKTINQFCLLLSPYFLTNAAHKALEWLFHRFAVNEYNRKDLLLLALPYHNSNIFVKVIQTLKFENNNDPFYFLKSLQKPGLQLPKQNLLNCGSNLAFLKCVSKYIDQLVNLPKHSNLLTTQFNFYCTVFLGAIEYSTDIGEDLVSQMLPLIFKGLNSTIPDFTAATYVIIARLMVKRQFSEKLLNKILEKLSFVKCISLKMEATLVLLVIYQSQTQFTDLPPQALANLSEKEWLPNCLQFLNSNGNNVYPFLKVLMKKGVEEGINNDILLSREMVTNILNEVKLDGFFVEHFLCSIMDVFNYKTKYSEEANQWLCDIVNKLEIQYPSNFDQIVGNILSNKTLSFEKKTNLQKIMGHIITHKENFEIYKNLYHTQESIRNKALGHLLENFENLKKSDQELFKNYLFNRLNDEDPEVVKKTLNLILQINIKNDPLLQNILMDLFRKETLLNWNENDIFVLAANVLCSDKEFSWEIFVSIFPFIILYSNKHLEDVKKLFKLGFFSKSNMFSKFSKEVASLNNADKSFVNSFLTYLDSNADSKEVAQILKIVNVHSKTDCMDNYSAIFIVSHLLPNECSPEISTSVIQLVKTFNVTEKTSFKGSFSLETYLKKCLRKKCPSEGIKICLEKIVSKTIMPEKNCALNDFTDESVHSKFSHNLCSLVFSNHFLEDVFKSYLNFLAADLGTKINICLNLCASESISSSCMNRVLVFIGKLLKAKRKSEEYTKFENITTSYLLILLNSTNIEIRKSTLDLIDRLLKSSLLKSGNHFNLLERILEHKEEISVDNEQTPLIIHNILAPANTKMKNSNKKAEVILSDLLSLACENTIPMYLKSGILSFLSHINNFEMFENLCKNSLELYENNEVINAHKSLIFLNLINRVDTNIIREVTLNSSIWKFIKYALKNNHALVINDQKTYLTVLMLHQLTRDVYGLLSDELLEEMLDIICEVSATLEEPEVLALSSKIFKHLDLNAKLITKLLERMKDIELDKSVVGKSKRRVNVTPTVDILDTLEWKKGIHVLEFLQGKKKIRNGEFLLPLLFDILKKCLDFEEQAAVEYPKQLILSLMLLICSKVEKEDVPKNFLNIELVIQCIRASQNPQTHHHALLVLANTAELVPTEVLHHVMAVFTFMGSSLIRHDDAYSFQIISKIIDTIIPILVNNGEVTAVVNVLRVFVDALVDVPEHRRIPMYKQLLSKVGAEENLYLFLLLVFEAQVLHSGQEKHRTEKGNLSQRLKIALNLCLDFSPKTVLSSCIKLVKYLRQLPDEKEDNMEIGGEIIMCNPNYTAKQFRHYKYLIVTFFTTLLSSEQFVNDIAELPDEKNLVMEDLYKEIIVTILTYIQRIQKISEQTSNSQQAQYWKTVLYHSYDILDSVNALLTPRMFLLVINGLLMHSIHTVKRRALELLNTKLQLNTSFFESCDRTEMYSLIPPVVTIIDILNKEEMTQENEILVQTALLSLKLLVKSLGSQEPEKFVKILEFITNILNSGKVQNNVLASVILCLVELCVHLRAHAISCLADFMPAFLRILKNQKHQDMSSMLLLSVVTVTNKLLDSVSLFLSPYLKKIMYEICILISKWNCSTKDQKSQTLVNKLNAIQQKIGSRFPPRVLIPAIEGCYDYLVEKRHFKAIGPLMDILAESITHLPVKEINAYMQELSNLFLKLLEFRCNNDSALNDANIVEEHIVKSLTVLVLKLSESTFRPLFLKLYDWAVRNDGKSDRLITFYNLLQTIARSLKGLFVLFASHFINNAAEILTKINSSASEEKIFNDEIKDILLLEFVLKTLQSVFTYDNQNFINKNRFDLLMQPLVDQLENNIGGVKALVDRNEKMLTPTITYFLSAVADDALWKQMNYQILLKMRNSTPDIRLAALHCLTEVVTKLGEDFLPLLPETIPFLAELLEDEEEKVEKSCQKAIHEMEKVLGEPLQKYF